jgi:acetyl-CoA carboxylase carboxyltransferase component
MKPDEVRAELLARREKALEMGGPEKVARQHARGKKTVRERLDLLLDPGSFQEYGQLASRLSEHYQSVDEITAADGFIFGFGQINGRYVCVGAEDFTVHGGSVGIIHMKKKTRAIELAIQEKVPMIWLLDGAGARAQDLIGEGLPECPHFLHIARHSGVAPQVALVMGPSAGDSSLIASESEFIVMVEGISMLAAGGPPIVEAATGQKVSKEELGGTDVHCRISGVADNPAATEEDAVAIAQYYLSFLPNNAWEYPPWLPTDDPFDRADVTLDTLVPDDLHSPYDMKHLIECVVDRNSFLEVKPHHAAMMITGFARMNGHPVGIVANQPLVGAGAITTQAANKARHFVDLCTAYHVPLIFFTDVPGVMPGPRFEREGALRAGMAMSYSLAWSDVPKVTVVIRKAFGYGSFAMCGAGADQTVVLAWPNADFASLPPSSSALAAHGDEIAASDDPEALMRELEAEYSQASGPLHAAGKVNIDDVIEPGETRLRINRALDLALSRRTAPATPTPRFGVMP